jgi:predicted nucleic acid-binding protein
MWLYAYVASGDTERHQRARKAVEDAQDLFISDQVVTEVAANLLRKARLPEADILSRLEDLATRCSIVRLDIIIHRRASRLRASDPTAFSYWDSLIIASALEAGCRELWSEDLQAGRVVEGRLTIVNPLTAVSR